MSHCVLRGRYSHVQVSDKGVNSRDFPFAGAVQMLLFSAVIRCSEGS